MASVKRIKASDGTGNASVATVQTLRAALATTITVDTVVGIYAGAEGFYATMGTPHTFTDPITSEVITVISDATAVDFQGHIDTGHIIIDAIAPGYVDAGSKVGDIIVIRPTTQWSNNASDTLAIAHNDDGTIKSPEGQMFNGVIVPSVASNNLTVAIKTLAGADPSATDPVYVNIRGTMHSITAALSVALNAGTNWFGKGSAPWATNATNFFVYLGFNATDGVIIGVSSTATGYKYSDFSVTNTDWTYAKISNITHAAATDVYSNIGRFNAILGVTATFLWTLPAGNLVISHPSREILQYPCRFRVWRSAAMTIGAGNTLIGFDTKTFDLGNNVDIVTNKGRFTAPVTGIYQFNAFVQSNINTGNYIGTMIAKNGSVYSQGDLIDVSNTIGMSVGVNDLIELNAGEYVEIFAAGTNGGAVQANQTTTYFSGFLVNQL